MNALEKKYIEVELGVVPFDELGDTASMHVYDRGITQCYAVDLYEIIWEHLDEWYDEDEGFYNDKLKKLLSDPDNVLLCVMEPARYDASFDDFVEWMEEKKEEELIEAKLAENARKEGK